MRIGAGFPGAPLRLLLVAGVLSGCSGSKEEGDGAAQAGETTETVVPVAVQVVTRGRVEAAVRAWGTVRPSKEATILSELSGRISAVPVALGDAVRQGDILLEIDPELYLARAAEAESRLQSATVSRERAVKELSRREALFQGGSISDSELDQARAGAAEAEAVLSAARAAVEQARKNLAGARLRAPFDGQVASRPPDPGSTVNPGTPLVILVSINRVKVEALISEQDLPRVHPGREATITAAGAPGTGFPGRVVAIGPQTDPSTKQFPVEIEVANPDGHPLKGGMVAQVEIIYESYEDIPLVPIDALIEDAEGYTIYTVDGGVAHRRRLTAGPREGSWLGARDGVSEGDSVVVLGQTRLTDGSAVRVEGVR